MGTSQMTRNAAGAVAVLLMAGALAAAGCGGGGSTSATTAAAGTTAGTTTSGVDSHKVPPSTQIASSEYFKALVQGFTQGGRLSQSQAESAAHCIQDGLTKAGFKTQGDAEGQNAKQAFKVVLTCVQKAKSQ